MQNKEITKILESHYWAVLSNIERLCSHKHLFIETRKIIQNNPKINIKNCFYTLISECYATTLFMGVRRHVKKNKRQKNQSYSLINLLYELKDYFEKKRDHNNIKTVCKDIETIEEYEKKYGIIIDQVIPHLDKGIIGKSVSYNIYELEECIENLHKSVMNYFHVIYPGDGYIGPHITDGETWTDIFKTPWIEEK